MRREVTGGGPGAEEIGRLPWLQVRAPADVAAVLRLQAGLGAGEAEAIALALEIPDLETVILDDGRARRRGTALGLPVTGTAGVLIAAKQRGVIPSLRGALDAVRGAGLYLSDAAYADALALGGE